jgi:hypothetical protein
MRQQAGGSPPFQKIGVGLRVPFRHPALFNLLNTQSIDDFLRAGALKMGS